MSVVSVKRGGQVMCAFEQEDDARRYYAALGKGGLGGPRIVHDF
jgi:hypothetical protein